MKTATKATTVPTAWATSSRNLPARMAVLVTVGEGGKVDGSTYV